MKNQKKAEFKVGITVIVATIILLWILGWAKNFSLHSEEKIISVSFQNVAGLSVGDQVSVQGIKEGYVKNLFNNNNTIIAEISLSNKILLKKDAKFSVMMLDLMGGKKIEIFPGFSNLEIDYSQVQNGQFAGDISTAMATLGSVQSDLVSVISEVKTTLISFNKILNNPKFIGDMESSVSSLNILIKKTDKILTENRSSLLELINNSNEFVSNSNNLVVENSDNIKSSLNDISGLVKSTDKLIIKLNSFFEEVENKENNVGKLLYDKDLVENLSITLKQLKDLSEMINKQLKEKGLKVDANIF